MLSTMRVTVNIAFETSSSPRQCKAGLDDRIIDLLSCQAGKKV